MCELLHERVALHHGESNSWSEARCVVEPARERAATEVDLPHTTRIVIIVAMASNRRMYPTRVALIFQRGKGQMILDQICTADWARLGLTLGRLLDPAMLQAFFRRCSVACSGWNLAS